MFATETVEGVLRSLQSSPKGLALHQVAALRAQYGFNELPEKKRSLLLLFLRQFQNVMVYILFGALILSLLIPILEGHDLGIDDFADAIVIFAILILNAILGFVQEFKAEEAIAMLRKLTSPTTRVRRSGKEQTIPSREVIPGDIVLLEAGDRISADGRILSVSHFDVNESSLTGESQPVHKHSSVLPKEVPLADQRNMVFSGTLVTMGSAEVVVTATALQTEVGKIAKMVSETVVPETPLQKRMEQLGKFLGLLVIALCGIIVAIGVFTGLSFLEILLMGVSLAVSAVPEGLPAVVTVCMAMGVRRMVKQNALVRRLESLEELGSVSVICADKTGTITQNRMKVIESALLPGQGLKDTSEEELRRLLSLIGASCNRAKLPDFGDPTEIGLLEFAAEQKVERLPFDEEEVPFTSEEKYMKTRHGERSFLKGAPEKIIALCDDVDGPAVLEKTKALASKGLRVLGCAVRESSTGKAVFVGLVGMEDPPRPGVREAIAEAKEAGIRTIMITGDNIETARAIAEQVGITGDAMEGAAIDRLSQEQLAERLRTVSIVARVSPVHKLAILNALKATEKVVAMSGDGVNDAPAIKGAHVGVAMGKNGTEVAREAASIILADDQYTTIVAAVREGRRIYDNIRKFVLFLLRSNFDELLFITTTVLLKMPLPYLPLHILWLNLMTDGLPALALGMEPAEPNVMKRPPRPVKEHLLSGEMTGMVLGTLLSYLLALGVFYWQLYHYDALDPERSLEDARTFTLMCAVTIELFFAITTRSSRPIWQVGLFSNPWMIGAVLIPFALQFVVLYTPLASVFHFLPLTWREWVMVLLLSSSGFFLFEGLKVLRLRKKAS